MTQEHVDRTLQKGLVLVYALATSAGLAATVWQPPSMIETIGSTWAQVWGLFALLGGSVCLVGTLIRRGAVGDWFGEYVGIWLVISAVALYAVVAASTLDGEPGRLPGVLLLASLSVLLGVRWFRVRNDAREQTARKNHHLPPTAATR